MWRSNPENDGYSEPGGEENTNRRFILNRRSDSLEIQNGERQKRLILSKKLRGDNDEEDLQDRSGLRSMR